MTNTANLNGEILSTVHRLTETLTKLDLTVQELAKKLTPIRSDDEMDATTEETRNTERPTSGTSPLGRELALLELKALATIRFVEELSSDISL